MKVYLPSWLVIVEASTSPVIRTVTPFIGSFVPQSVMMPSTLVLIGGVDVGAGVGLGLGVSVGLALGVDVAVGVGVGVAVGLGVGVAVGDGDIGRHCTSSE